MRSSLVIVGGILAAALLVFAATIVASNRALSDDEAAASAGTTTAPMDHMAATSGATIKGTSFAGAAPENAAELAKAHAAFPAALPPVPPGDVVKVHMVLKDVTIEIAPA